MPPEKQFWPRDVDELNRLAEIERDKFLPALRNLQFHQLVGLNLAMDIAFEEFKPAASEEDVRRGHRGPGNQLGNQG